MLEARSLTKSFGSVVALDGLNLQVRPGEIFCLLGANGAGKTTTLSLFLNFLRPTSGEVIVNGRNVMKFPREARQDLAYIPEVVQLYPHLTGLENLKYFASLAGHHRLSREELCGFLMQAGFPLDVADRRLGTYSKGMRQKVGIALALARNARAFLLDEPTSGLDPVAADDFSRTLKTLRDQGGAVLMSTHDLFRAKAIADRIGIMKSGRMIRAFTAEEASLTELETIYLDIMKMSALSQGTAQSKGARVEC